MKPQNFLVFQRETGEYYLKLADIGFSTLASKEHDDTGIDIPISRPWNAPELSEKQHGLSFSAAKATDVYSVGLLCWWLMLGEKRLDYPQDHNPWSGSYDWISNLKQSNGLVDYGQPIIEELDDVDLAMKGNLLNLFRWTTASKPDERIPRLTNFVDDLPAPTDYQPFENTQQISVRIF